MRPSTTTHSIVGAIDFTPGTGNLSEACLAAKILYTGFAQTAAGERVVWRNLFKRMWDLMCTPGSAHYDAALRALIGADDDAVAAAAPPTGGGAPASSAVPAPDGPAP